MRRVPVWALVPVAALVWWLGGYLFWLSGGLRSVPVGARLAVPLSESLLGQLVLGALVGGVAAGLLCLAAVPGRRGHAVAATAAGVALAVAVTVAQSAATLSGQNAPDALAGDARLVPGLTAVVVVVACSGWALGSASALGRPGAGVALAVLAGALPLWVVALALSAADGYSPAAVWWGRAGIWLAAAVMVGALVTVGLRPPARLLWWAVAVAAAWIVSPLVTAATSLGQVMQPGARLVDSLDGAAHVFGDASSLYARDLLPWVVALPIAAFAAVLLPPSRDHRQLAGPLGESTSHPPMITEP